MRKTIALSMAEATLEESVVVSEWGTELNKVHSAYNKRETKSTYVKWEMGTAEALMLILLKNARA